MIYVKIQIKMAKDLSYLGYKV